MAGTSLRMVKVYCRCGKCRNRPEQVAQQSLDGIHTLVLL